jgi:hypothetical protein
MGYELLAQALQDYSNDAAASNPWMVAGKSLSGSANGYRTKNPWEAIAASFVQSMAGGALTNYGLQDVKADEADFAKRWTSALGQPDVNSAFIADKELAPYAGSVAAEQFAEQRALEDYTARTLAQAAIQDRVSRGESVEGFSIGRNPQGRLSVEFPQAAAPAAPLTVTDGDPMMQDYLEGVAIAKAQNMPQQQQSVFANNYAERKQMARARKDQLGEAASLKRELAAKEEGTKALVQAEKFTKDAQALETNLQIRGDDTYTGKLGELGYWWDKNFNADDPKVSAAKELGLIGASNMRDIRSDAQIAEAERRILQDRLVSESSPGALVRSRAEQLKLMANVNTEKAKFIQDVAKVMSPDEAKLVWAQAYGRADLVGKDPKTNASRWITPDEFQQQMTTNLMSVLTGQKPQAAPTGIKPPANLPTAGGAKDPQFRQQVDSYKQQLKALLNQQQAQ